MTQSIAAQRLRNQHISRPGATAHEVVSSLGAIQAQDYLGALWAVGLRMRNGTEGGVERALAEGTIVRTWPLRGTLHFVAAEDARWMLELLAPRVVARQTKRLEREHGVTAEVLKRSRVAVTRALEGGHALTRAQLYAALEKSRVDTDAQRGLQIVWRLAHEGLICFGPRQGKQQTFVLFDEWVPATQARSRDEALGELARRYFTSHGPATLADFIWWSGLAPSDAKRAGEIAGERHTRAARVDASVYLLPPFDEFTVGYKDRAAIVDPAFVKGVNAGGGMIQAVIVAGGRVVGTWKRILRGDAVEITPSWFRALTPGEQRAFSAAATRYARFLGRTVR